MQAGEALRASEERLRLMIENATEYAIFSMDLQRRVTMWNSGAERLLGWSEPDMIGRPGDIIFTEEDLAKRAPDDEMQTALRDGRAEDDRMHRRKDGSRFWASGVMMVMRNAAGELVGFVKVLRDQTGQRRAEERQRLLINELNHRVKNTLATVQSIARQTLKALPQADGTLATFEGRLMALAKAHDVLTRESWDGAELREIVAEAMAAHSHESDRFEMIGPELRLEPRTALAIAMAVHELATNAAKYGALSVPAGRVAASWSVVPGDPRWLTFRWEEKNGPPVREPTHRGFGTRLVRSLASELGGEVRLAYEPSGVTCVVAAPLHDRPVIPEEGIVIA
jgi:PAS domain S-box-containing protein